MKTEQEIRTELNCMNNALGNLEEDSLEYKLTQSYIKALHFVLYGEE